MSKITASADLDKVKPEEIPRYVSILASDIIAQVNGGLDFATNFNQKTVTATFSSANTDTAIQHNLGRVPVGYFSIGQTAALIVYNGTSPSTSSVIYLRASAAGSATLIFF
jgi:hypothetical protein